MDEKIENSIVALNSKNASRLNVGISALFKAKFDFIAMHSSILWWLVVRGERGGWAVSSLTQ